MKTSIVVKTWTKTFLRAAKPEDGKLSAWLIPQFVSAHTACGRNGKGETEWQEPDCVCAKSNRFRPVKGQVKEIRQLAPADVVSLQLIDDERDRLQQQLAALAQRERDCLEAAWKVGEPVTVAEVIEWGAFRAKAAATGGAA